MADKTMPPIMENMAPPFMPKGAPMVAPAPPMPPKKKHHKKPVEKGRKANFRGGA